MVSRYPQNRVGHRAQSLGGLVTFVWLALGFPLTSLAAPSRSPASRPPASAQVQRRPSRPSTAQAPALPPAAPPTTEPVAPAPGPFPPLNTSPVNPGGGLPQLGEDFYTLGAGDRVRVDVFGLPEYSGENQVLSDGTLTVPLVGSVMVQGLTLREASKEMESRYAAFLKNPVITIIILSTRPVKIAIAGEVDRPGLYAVGSTTTAGAVGPVQGANIVTVSGAIQLAGGLRQSADLSRVQIRRAPTRSGGQRTVTVDLRPLIKAGDNSQDILLRDGDNVFIPATEGFANLEDSRLLANSGLVSLTPRPLKISLVGEVYRPGPYTLNTGVQTETSSGQGTAGRQSVPGQGNSDRVPTLTKAIQIAGGITQMADVRQIKVKRLVQGGTGTQEITVDFWKLLDEGALDQDLPLQDGDTIIIPTAKTLASNEALRLGAASFSPATISVYLAGIQTVETSAPGTAARPVQLPPNIPLMQAVMSAGGRTIRAAKRIELVRFNPDGTLTRKEYKFDKTQALNAETNPPLRNNDIVIVHRSRISQVGDTLGLFLAPIINILGGYDLFRRTFRDGADF